MEMAKALNAAGVRPCSDRLYASSTAASTFTCKGKPGPPHLQNWLGVAHASSFLSGGQYAVTGHNAGGNGRQAGMAGMHSNARQAAMAALPHMQEH